LATDLKLTSSVVRLPAGSLAIVGDILHVCRLLNRMP
jgi:hypothetical protein